MADIFSNLRDFDPWRDPFLDRPDDVAGLRSILEATRSRLGVILDNGSLEKPYTEEIDQALAEADFASSITARALDDFRTHHWKENQRGAA